MDENISGAHESTPLSNAGIISLKEKNQWIKPIHTDIT